MELETKISDAFVKSAHPREPISSDSLQSHTALDYWKDINEPNQCISFFRNASNLTSNEMNLIRDKPREVWIVSFVNFLARHLDYSVLDKIGKAFFTLDGNHYIRFQCHEWGETEKRLLRENFHRDPSENEIMEDCEKNLNFERYRLCYVLEFPDMVSFSKKGYLNCRDYADAFVTFAEMLDPEGKPYFDKISSNSCPVTLYQKAMTTCPLLKQVRKSLSSCSVS